MKKVLLIITVALFGWNVSAQEEGIRFGAKAGLNLSTVTGDVGDDVSSRTSFHVGGLVEIPLSEKFAFQPELLLSFQGAKSEFSESIAGFDFSSESTTKLSYLNIPLMAKFYVAEGFSIAAGPQVGILLSARDEGEFRENGEVEEYDDDVKEFVNTLDLGLNFGLGYQLESGLFFSGRYNLGLTDLNKDQDDEFEGEEEDGSVQNSVIQISVGFKF